MDRTPSRGDGVWGGQDVAVAHLGDLQVRKVAGDAGLGGLDAAGAEQVGKFALAPDVMATDQVTQGFAPGDHLARVRHGGTPGTATD
jgi:hypothetical protein